MIPILSSSERGPTGEQALRLLSEHPGGKMVEEGTDRPDPGAVLVLKGLTKTYSGVRALSNVDLSVLPGEVHAIVGQNGAGKSTLLKIVAGLTTPDSGTIYVNGLKATISSPRVAHSYGISAVPQELSLVKHVTVAENICMMDIPARRGFLDRRELRARAEAVLASLGLDIDPFSVLGQHGPGIQELVMIGRAFSQESRVVVLDEPTAALTAPEIDHLFDVIRSSQRRGTAYLYVSHRLAELSRIGQRLTVLSDGQRVVTGPVTDFDHDEIVRAMLGGRDLGEKPAIERRAAVERNAGRSTQVTAREDVPPRLRVTGLTRRDTFHDVSFCLRRGEIVGMAGLIGSGRTEVARAIFGVDRLDEGTIELDGRPTRIRSVRQAVRAGLAMVPEERKQQALVLGMSVGENLTIRNLPALSYRGWLLRRREATEAKKKIDQLHVRTYSVDAPVGSLSGGNQQKVVIGRWLFNSHRVYLFDEPTRGVDIGAKFAIYDLLFQLRDSGAGILAISSELTELLHICDRILVMNQGRLVKEVTVDDALMEEDVLQWAVAPPSSAVTN
jgi:ABC-type sugar transport system ATPase subunit